MAAGQGQGHQDWDRDTRTGTGTLGQGCGPDQDAGAGQGIAMQELLLMEGFSRDAGSAVLAMGVPGKPSPALL